MSYNSKYTGQEVENLLDQVASGNAGGGGGGVAVETDPVFMASPAANITAENIASWNNKVDKVDGKQLSTEDFTPILKQKLEGLSNYDDAAINQVLQGLQTQVNTLVSGNASAAIESFNEIVAFLDGITDSQDLDSIIASIEQQIAGKMDNVTLAAVATSGSFGDLSDVPTASTSAYGITALSEAVNSTARNVAATPSAVKKAYDLAASKGNGTVKSVKINGSTKTPDADGLVDLGTIEGGSTGGENGSDGEVYITPFSAEQFCTSSVELTDEQRNELLNAASQNRIIGMSYDSNCSKGYIVTDYRYLLSEDDDTYWSLELGVIYNEAHYSNQISSNGSINFGLARLIISPFSPFIYFVGVEDGVAYVSDDTDNCIYWVDGECTELFVYLEPSMIGKTVRFFTGESCTLEIPISVYWANGEVPTMEPYTHYELSLVMNTEGGFNAVLTPFKPVE